MATLIITFGLSFQGSGAKEGKKAGMRIVNGWQNDGLLWSMKLNPEKIYQP